MLTRPPKPELPAPTQQQLREALRLVRADFGPPISTLAEGWCFHTYVAGDYVLRFPKRAEFAQNLQAEAAIVSELEPGSPVRISVITVHEHGPNGLPFTAHCLVPGSQPAALTTVTSAETIGRFLSVLHSYPVQRAVALGLTLHDWRQHERVYYDTVRAKALPLLPQAARAYLEAMFEAFLDNDANFAFAPSLVHNDINARNVLVDPETADVGGVIDFGNLCIGDPALDFTDILCGRLVSRDPALLAAVERGYGRPLAPMRARCEFYSWPVYRIMVGLEADDEQFLEDGVQRVLAHIAERTKGRPPG